MCALRVRVCKVHLFPPPGRRRRAVTRAWWPSVFRLQRHGGTDGWPLVTGDRRRCRQYYDSSRVIGVLVDSRFVAHSFGRSSRSVCEFYILRDFFFLFVLNINFTTFVNLLSSTNNNIESFIRVFTQCVTVKDQPT